MKILFRLVILVIAIVLAVFAVSNRGAVELAMWPLPGAIGLPRYLLVLAMLLVGFIVGQVSAWIGGRRWRRELRQANKRIAALQAELDAAHAKLRDAAGPAASHPLVTADKPLPISRQ